MTLSLEDVLKATGGRLLAGTGSVPFTGITTDTRSVTPGALFVPLRGERFDGHDFLTAAVRAGAAGVLVARDGLLLPPEVVAVRVEDTLAAYGDLARYWRELLGLQVVAVTGSSGKTSTKELIATLLSRYMPTGKTHANYNNEIGVPRTLLGMEPETRACVLELGMRGPGEIAYLASVARPDVGVITHIGTAHIGRLGSQEAIARAKGELLRVGGPTMAAVLNADDPYSMALGADHPGPVITFSREGRPATVTAHGEGRSCHVRYQAGVRPAGELRLTLPLAGPHHQSNALAAIAVAWHLGLALPATLELAPEELPGRARVLQLGDLEVVDETYNANPESVAAALRGFCAEPCRGRRVVVLGEMGELGTHAESAHRQVGRVLRDLDVAQVFTVGTAASWIAEEVGIHAHHVPDQASLVTQLEAYLAPGDRVLVKGSRSTRMELVVAALERKYGALA